MGTLASSPALTFFFNPLSSREKHPPASSLGGLSQAAPPLQVKELALALGFLAPRPVFDLSPWNVGQ